MQQLAARSTGDVLLHAQHIGKRFGATTALSDASFELCAGEILAVAGENGAGKSTLMKIVAGMIPAGDFEGEVRLSGRDCAFHSISDAEARGIILIPQELQVAPDLSVTENMLAGHLPRRFGLVRHSEAERIASQWARFFSLAFEPSTRMRSLSPSEQRLVMIAGALARDAQVLILDEPTVALAASEREVLFEHVRRLREEGKGILFVSHQLDEIGDLADRVIAIRNGAVTAELATRPRLDQAALIRAMLGRDVEQVHRVQTPTSKGEIAMTVSNLTVFDPYRKQRTAATDVTFDLHKGEILGLFGIIGAGASPVASAIAGAWPGKTRGVIAMPAWSGTFSSPRAALRGGVVMLTGNRQATGIMPQQSVMANVSAGSLAQAATAGFVSASRERDRVEELVHALSISTPTIDAPIGALSGGNQQKVLLARCLAARASTLILEEPTVGIDIGSRMQIYESLHRLADQGAALLMVSTDVEEIASQCDRILVFRRGQIIATCPGGTDGTILLSLATGDTQTEYSKDC